MVTGPITEKATGQVAAATRPFGHFPDAESAARAYDVAALAQTNPMSTSKTRIATDTPGPDGSPIIGAFWTLTVTAWRKTTQDYGVPWTRGVKESQPPDGYVSFGVRPRDICRLTCPVIDFDATFKIPDDARGVIPVEALVGEMEE